MKVFGFPLCLAALFASGLVVGQGSSLLGSTETTSAVEGPAPTLSSEPYIPWDSVPGHSSPTTILTGVTSPDSTTDTATAETNKSTKESEPPITSTDVQSETSTTNATASETTSSAEATSTDITLMSDADVTESNEEIPEDITTPEQHSAELVVNLPSTQPDEGTAREIAAMETIFFDDFARNAPAPADAGKVLLPANVSNCQLKRRSLLGSAYLGSFIAEDGFLARRLLGNMGSCTPVRSLTVNIHWNYIKRNRTASVPGMGDKSLKNRINQQMALLKSVYGPIGITFVSASYMNWKPPAKGSNSDWSVVKKDEARLVAWQKQSYEGGKTDLNVWLVNDLNTATGNPNLNGYATFPEDYTKTGSEDGIVMEQARIGPSISSTLVHEIGHWLGLYHTFGRQVKSASADCKVGDGLLDTTLTRGDEAWIYKCEQVPCYRDLSSAPEKVTNYMSYSPCRGGDQAFTTDQKAAMFARYLTYRRGYKPGECKWLDPKSQVAKRDSSMQDLVNGNCPDVQAQAARVQSAQKAETPRTTTNPVTTGSAKATGGGGSATTPTNAAGTGTGTKNGATRMTASSLGWAAGGLAAFMMFV